MVTVMLEAVLEYEAEPEDKYSMSDFVDRMFDELLAIGVKSPHVTVDKSKSLVYVGLSVDPDIPDPFLAGMGDIRTAVHAAGGKTQGWQLKFRDIHLKGGGSTDRPEENEDGRRFANA